MHASKKQKGALNKGNQKQARNGKEMAKKSKQKQPEQPQSETRTLPQGTSKHNPKHPRAAPEQHKALHKGAPLKPKVPKTPQEHPRIPQKAARAPQEHPKAPPEEPPQPQEWPKCPNKTPEHTQSSPREPQSAQMLPKSSPNQSKNHPKRAHGAPRSKKGPSMTPPKTHMRFKHYIQRLVRVGSNPFTYSGVW